MSLIDSLGSLTYRVAPPAPRAAGVGVNAGSVGSVGEGKLGGSSAVSVEVGVESVPSECMRVEAESSIMGLMQDESLSADATSVTFEWNGEVSLELSFGLHSTKWT